MAKGKKTGGRVKGVQNKMMIERSMQLSGELSPLDYMLGLLRDPEQRPELRFEAAKGAAPYVHPKLTNVELSGNKDAPLTIEIVRFANPAAK